jgi:hypothetical protein
MVHSYLCRPLKRRVRLRARTPPFHGGDTGSNPVRGTHLPNNGRFYFYIQKPETRNQKPETRN